MKVSARSCAFVCQVVRIQVLRRAELCETLCGKPIKKHFGTAPCNSAG